MGHRLPAVCLTPATTATVHCRVSACKTGPNSALEFISASARRSTFSASSERRSRPTCPKMEMARSTPRQNDTARGDLVRRPYIVGLVHFEGAHRQVWLNWVVTAGQDADHRESADAQCMGSPGGRPAHEPPHCRPSQTPTDDPDGELHETRDRPVEPSDELRDCTRQLGRILTGRRRREASPRIISVETDIRHSHPVIHQDAYQEKPKSDSTHPVAPPRCHEVCLRL